MAENKSVVDNRPVQTNFKACLRCYVVKESSDPHPTKMHFTIHKRTFNCRVCGEKTIEQEIPSFVLGLSEDERKYLSENVVEYPPKPNKPCDLKDSPHTCTKAISQACKKCTSTLEHSFAPYEGLEWCTYKGLSGCKNCLRKRKSMRYSNI